MTIVSYSSDKKVSHDQRRGCVGGTTIGQYAREKSTDFEEFSLKEVIGKLKLFCR